MSHVDAIAQDLHDQRIIARMEDEEAHRYGTTDPATLRAINEHEARLYRDEGLLETCVGCGAEHSIFNMAICEECGEQVCADCPATCPHAPEEATR